MMQPDLFSLAVVDDAEKKKEKRKRQRHAVALFQLSLFDLQITEKKERKPRIKPPKKESPQQIMNRIIDERNKLLPIMRPAFRINRFRHQVILLAQLKRFWLTMYDVAEECGVTTRTAKKLLAWAQAHYYVETRRHEETIEKEHHIKNPVKRSIRSRACFYECCDDIRERKDYGDVVIAEYEHGTHMFRELAPEFHERSGFQIGPDIWLPIGKGAPARTMCEAELIQWLCEIPMIDADVFTFEE